MKDTVEQLKALRSTTTALCFSCSHCIQCSVALAFLLMLTGGVGYLCEETNYEGCGRELVFFQGINTDQGLLSQVFMVMRQIQSDYQ